MEKVLYSLPENDRDKVAAWIQSLGELINNIADDIELSTPETLPDKVVLLLRLSNELKVTASKIKYTD